MSRKYDDEYEGSSFEKFTHRKNKKSGKGHQSHSNRENKWDYVMANEYVPPEPREPKKTYNTPFIPTTPAKVTVTPTDITRTQTEHQFGVNTHEIKGVKIDFDGVLGIEKVENVKDGITTYGIKFLFKGKKGLFRIIWFNTNLRGRDAAYNTEYAFWLTLQNK